MKKLRSSDEVIVIAGKCKGERGKITKILPNGRVFVEGVNLVSKHAKPSADNPQGGIIKKEASLDISNLGLIENGVTVRVGYTVEGDKKVRVSKKTNKAI